MDEFDEEGDELMLSVDLPLAAQHNEHTAKIGLGDDKSSSHSRQFSSGAGSLVDKPESGVMDSVDGKIWLQYDSSVCCTCKLFSTNRFYYISSIYLTTPFKKHLMVYQHWEHFYE